MARWGLRAGRWYQVQWSFDGTLSLGVHVDPLRRLSDTGPYGPYVDLHIGPVVLSLGSWPGRAADPVTLYGQSATMRAR